MWEVFKCRVLGNKAGYGELDTIFIVLEIQAILIKKEARFPACAPRHVGFAPG